MQEYLVAPPGSDGKTPVERSAELDQQRIKIIEEELLPLLSGYLEGKVPLSDFKSRVDGINKRNLLWGFRGIKGQMFFNMVVNTADHIDECDQELRMALSGPANEQTASSRIKTFVSYVKRLGEQWVQAGNTRYGAPKASSTLFFLSYFWQIQGRNVWPICYTNSVDTMSDLNFWQPSVDLAGDYLKYKAIHEELVDLFANASGRKFSLYDVEHVFWFKGGKSYRPVREGGDTLQQEQPIKDAEEAANKARLPESYVPPIVAILPRIARHEDALVEVATRSGTSLAQAFEKYVATSRDRLAG